MKNTSLNTLFVVLLVITLILFAFNFTLDSIETEENIQKVNELTGAVITYEITPHDRRYYHPTKKYTERYDEKLIDYLDRIQKSRDETFHKGKVFLIEK